MEKSTAGESQPVSTVRGTGDHFYNAIGSRFRIPEGFALLQDRCSAVQYYSTRQVSGHCILFARTVLFFKYPVQSWRHVIRLGRTAIVPFKIFTWRTSRQNRRMKEWKMKEERQQGSKEKES